MTSRIGHYGGVSTYLGLGIPGPSGYPRSGMPSLNWRDRRALAALATPARLAARTTTAATGKTRTVCQPTRWRPTLPIRPGRCRQGALEWQPIGSHSVGEQQ